ncbi:MULTISPECIES: GspE/PulE family protein [Vibrio]|uniref:Bacterial type II secretion system protein E domain-containing protein n=1 Tax=Vibrio tasmaniensis TaxID=212663 RepID=A0A2N7NNE9_9VIBR|nr:ATPase, T2SS/T4P/T4SS family [Vibrio tasmaniensis]PMO80314.1 hypothetical protein BCT01_08465 [Vibrio tasmaniensis]PMP17818.1 hypothetical protein BCS92_05265 [Vibrio tasmaniensis]TKG29023.1 hypothetical protein FC057_20265 [Vibrio tasmaniensis]TKG41578.1 hypothetical protein FC063_06885 [Vibrio tasmaniensis]TKG46227.1 hypothetical protein FC070_22350 [Vibrio tasmaniensis]
MTDTSSKVEKLPAVFNEYIDPLSNDIPVEEAISFDQFEAINNLEPDAEEALITESKDWLIEPNAAEKTISNLGPEQQPIDTRMLELKSKLETTYALSDIDMAKYLTFAADEIPIIPLRSAVLVMTKESLKLHNDIARKLKLELIESGQTKAKFKIVTQEDFDALMTTAEESKAIHSVNRNSEETTAVAKREFEKIVQKGYDVNASDIQFVLGHDLVVNYIVDKRVRSNLRIVKGQEMGDRLISQAINTNKGGGDINYDSPQSIPFKANVKDKDNHTKRIQLRAEKVPIVIDGVENALGLVIRMVKTETPLTLDQLNADAPVKSAFKKAFNKPQGMTLVTGPTSSGKTTLLGGALYYFPQDLTARTLEDPVELKLNEINPNIMQMSQPKEKWDEFLSSILRLAPKLIMLGETRTLMQAETLIQATMTGHITVSTLHTNSAIGIIDRLLDIGVPLEDLTTPKLLELLVATRLAPKTCQKCALVFEEISAERQAIVKQVMGDLKDYSQLRFANIEQTPCLASQQPKACVCTNGVKGMVGITEFIKPTLAMTDFIRKNKTTGLETWLRERGWVSMKDVAIFKAKKGEIDIFMAASEIDGLLEEEEYDPHFHDIYSYYS